MAVYKQACIHCGVLLERDARFCPQCASNSPFGYQCPTCLRDVKKGERVCSRCGRPLYIPCPHCEQQSFVQSHCEHCGQTMMVPCSNKRCGVMQFFENKKCTACGKTIKAKIMKG